MLGKLSPKEFGAAAGIAAEQVRRYLRGHAHPQRKVLLRIATFFKLDLNQLIEGTDWGFDPAVRSASAIQDLVSATRSTVEF